MIDMSTSASTHEPQGQGICMKLMQEFVPFQTGSLLEVGLPPSRFSTACQFDRNRLEYSQERDPNSRAQPVLFEAIKELSYFALQNYPSKSFDVLFSFNVIDRLDAEELDNVLALHDRLLRAGGYIVIAIDDFSRSSIGDWMRPPETFGDFISADMFARRGFFDPYGYKRVFCGTWAQESVSSFSRYLNLRRSKLRRLIGYVGRKPDY